MFFRKRWRGYFLGLLIISTVQALPILADAQEASAEHFPARDLPSILDRLEGHWYAAMKAVKAGDLKGAETSLKRVLEAKWDAGIRDLPAHSLAMLKLAWDAGRTDAARLYLNYSRELAPNHAGAGLARGRYFLKGDNLSIPLSAREYLSIVPDIPEDFEAVRYIVAILGLSAILIGFTSIIAFSLIMLAKYLSLFIHDVGDIFPPGFMSRWVLAALPALLIFIPLFFGAPFWVLTIFWILLMSFYMGRGERLIAALLFLAFLAAPFLFGMYLSSLVSLQDEDLTSILRIRNGVYSDSDIERLITLDDESADLAVLLSLGLTSKREGHFKEAADYYARARRDESYQHVTYNNIGNLYLAVGQIEVAINSYNKAMGLAPGRVEPVYNLSQAYYELLDFEKQDRYYKRAEAMDGLKVNEFDKMKVTRSITRTVIDIPVPSVLLLKRMLQSSTRNVDMRRVLWDEYFRFLDSRTFPLLGIGGLIILGIITLLGQRLPLSYTCSSCGQPVCRKCNPPGRNPSFCQPCYSVFYGHGGLDPKLRTKKMLSARRYRRLAQNAGLITTIVLPGSGHLFRGRSVTGFVFLLVSCVIVALVFSGQEVRFLTTPGFMLSFPPALAVKGACYLLLMVIALAHYFIAVREEA